MSSGWLTIAILTRYECEGLGHISPPTSPENLNAEFTEDIFGTDEVFLTRNDTNGSDDIGFTVARDGQQLADPNPLCLDILGVPDCTPASTSYFDTDVSRGKRTATRCRAITTIGSWT